MRILLASHSSLKTRGGWYYGTAQKLMNGFVRLGHSVEFFSDRDLSRSFAPLGLKPWGIARMNQLFLDFVERYAPEFILLCHADQIANASLNAARGRRPGLRIAELRVDPLHNRHAIPHLAGRRGHVDQMFLTTAGSALALVGSRQSPACFIPNPVDPAIETGRPRPLHETRFDAIYTKRPGEQPPRDYRHEVLEAIAAIPGVALRSIGLANDAPGLFGRCYFEAIEQTRVGLNLSQRPLLPISGHDPASLMRLYSSDRIAHYGGSGLALLIPRCFGLAEIMVEGREFLAFDSAAEASEMLAWLMEHPAERLVLAEAAHKAFHTRFSVDKVASFILAKTIRTSLPSVDWPSEDHCG